MNKVHAYRALEREYVTSQISIRELCRRHGIRAHSLVVVQARKGNWQAKREAYHARSSEAFIEKHADRMADRQGEIHDHALDAIDDAITKFRADLKATKLVRQPDGTVVEEPAWVMTPVTCACSSTGSRCCSPNPHRSASSRTSPSPRRSPPPPSASSSRRLVA